jgi:hypothetical protein
LDHVPVLLTVRNPKRRRYGGEARIFLPPLVDRHATSTGSLVSAGLLFALTANEPGLLGLLSGFGGARQQGNRYKSQHRGDLLRVPKIAPLSAAVNADAFQSEQPDRRSQSADRHVRRSDRVAAVTGRTKSAVFINEGGKGAILGRAAQLPDRQG